LTPHHPSIHNAYRTGAGYLDGPVQPFRKGMKTSFDPGGTPKTVVTPNCGQKSIQQKTTVQLQERDRVLLSSGNRAGREVTKDAIVDTGLEFKAT